MTLQDLTRQRAIAGVLGDVSDGIPDVPPVLTDAECRALGARILARATGGDTLINIASEVSGGIRWGRNAVSAAHQAGNHSVTVVRLVGGKCGVAGTNELSDTALAACVATAERLAAAQDPAAFPALLGPQTYLTPALHSPATAALSAAQRSARAGDTVRPVLAAHVLAAGYLATADRVTSLVTNHGLFAYFAETTAEYSTTVRDPAHRASGWAGTTSFDWARIDPAALGATALEKCRASANPVAIEPGRYTAILEPQAVADLLLPLLRQRWDRSFAERGFNAFSGEKGGTTKLGQRLFDPRISVISDPMDPDGGYCPFTDDGTPLARQTWIEHGVLTTLAYGRQYAKVRLHSDSEVLAPSTLAARMTGGETSLAEMIATADRAVLVTRFNFVASLNARTLVCTGNTRDGLWLVEHGKITKAIRNFRFTESPLFAFNNVELLGRPVRVYSPRPLFESPTPLVVPPMRVRDFNFTATLDSV
jgi:predicted Zn-dependent protease